MAKRARQDYSRLSQSNVRYQGHYVDVDDEPTLDIKVFTDLIPEGPRRTLRMDAFRDALTQEMDDLITGECLPYATAEGWPWIHTKYLPKVHDSMIWSVLTLLFAVYCRMAVGYIDPDNDEFRPVQLLFPLPSNAKYAHERSRQSLYYINPQNEGVYIDLHSRIEHHIVKYVNLLKDLNYFNLAVSEDDPGNGQSFAPASVFPKSVAEIRLMLVGDIANAPNVTANLDPELKFGVRYIHRARRRQWGINKHVLIIPDPMDRQELEQLMYIRDRRVGESTAAYEAYKRVIQDKRKDHIPRIHLVPSKGHSPCIPDTRSYNNVDMADFRQVLDAVNGAIWQFTRQKDSGVSDERLLNWISTLCVNMLHDFTPNFMSYIGAQYLQRICLKFQSSVFRDANPSLPRAYFSDYIKKDDNGDDYRVYLDDMTPDEERLVASFVDSFGSLFFAIQSTIVACVGDGGSGKNFLRRLAVNIVGGYRHTFRIDKNFGKFGMSKHHDETFLFVVEDASSEQVDIPETIMDTVLGGKRGKKEEAANIEPKFGQETLEKIEGTCCFYVRNEPTMEARSIRGKCKQEQIRACVAGVGGGRERRVRVVPPLMEVVCRGPINPVDDTNTLAFNEHKVYKTEIPYIILICWMTTTLSEFVRDNLYGVCGEGGNELLEELNTRYMKMGLSNVRENIKKIVDYEEPRVFKYTTRNREHTVRYAHSVSLQDLKRLYNTKFKNSDKLKTLPEGFEFRKQAYRCSDCHIVIDGKNHTTSVPAAHKACTNDNRDDMVKDCPQGNGPCYKKMVHCRSILYGYKIKSR